MALRSVSNIVCSGDFTGCINNDQNVVSFGKSVEGAHGHKEDNVFPPKIISSLNHIISISIGNWHCACLDNDGNVYTFGRNYQGQLGIGENLSFISIPKKVNLPPCTQISCGNNHTVCLNENGEVYSFGYNTNGQLGIGNNESSCNSPQLISSLKDVEFIDCNGDHTFCKTTKNKIYCWGNNYHGQLGLASRVNQNTPILCSSLSNEDVIDIKCGSFHTLVLTSNGDVLSCGNNEYGKLGRETGRNKYDQLGREPDKSSANHSTLLSTSFQKIEELSEITRIECGYNHSLCIDIKNDLYVFGDNRNGQLGLGDTDNRDKPMKHPSLSNIIDISHGGWQTFVKTSNNEIYAFGNNIFLQLGIKTERKNQITPIRVFEDNEDIWFSKIKSKAKSARK